MFPFLSYPLPILPGPLARFLPPLPEGLVRHWLLDSLPRGSLVLDPFGSQPRLAVEAARSGYRVLVASHNPIERLLTELTARPPSPEELQAAIADLSVSMIGGERLESHIRSLYKSECIKCGENLVAEAFVWDQEVGNIREAQYRCTNCLTEGLHPANSTDLERAAQFRKSGLHWSRAIERVTPLDDPDRIHAEEALETYTPRSVYALITVINKLQSLSADRQRSIRALLISAFDHANILWSYQTPRERPRQLKIPNLYVEKNVWTALEEAAENWKLAKTDPPVTIVNWPETPPEDGGIAIFPGPLRALVESWPKPSAPEIKVRGVISAIPRPNQAYWTLSALWSGWLWGPEATASFKGVLRRRRYDWQWHCSALQSVFRNLNASLELGCPVFGSVGESEPGYLAAALIAAKTSGLKLTGIALREEVRQAQLLWRIDGSGTGGETRYELMTAGDVQTKSKQGAIDYLAQRGEPANYLQLYTAVMASLVQNFRWAPNLSEPPGESLSLIQDSLNKMFKDNTLFIRYGASERSLDTGKWWLKQEKTAKEHRGLETRLSLADRVEMSTVQYLQKNAGCSTAQADLAVCQEFDGLLAPDPGLVKECLGSYGEIEDTEGDRWRLRAQDESAARRADLASMNAVLKKIGSQMGFTVEEIGEEEGAVPMRIKPTVRWLASADKMSYFFYILASAVISDLLTARLEPQGWARPEETGGNQQKIVVIPGSRAGLVLYKLESDPRLKGIIESGWRFAKYRLLNRLADNANLDQSRLDSLLELDPLANKDPQMPLM